LKEEIKNLVYESIKAAQLIEPNDLADIQIEISRTKNPEHGQFSCNIALNLSKKLELDAIDLAHQIAENINNQKSLKKIVVAPPGFINFYLSEGVKAEVVKQVLKLGDEYGSKTIQQPKNIILEFVSSNPTGPLHIGHGRQAAYGDSLSKLLRKAGHQVYTEYYVNDSGRQMNILAISILIEILNLKGASLSLPRLSYQGSYLEQIAQEIQNSIDLSFDDLLKHQDLRDSYPSCSEDEEIDKLIVDFQNQLGIENFEQLTDSVSSLMVAGIKKDLEQFGVIFNNWFSEREMINKGLVKKSIKQLNNNNLTYKKGGALWLKTMHFGDDKDRVIIREDGRSTYFASDIAYHFDKRTRGFGVLLNVLGSDHHGYLARLRAGLASMNEPQESLEISLVQFVSLFKENKKIQMSTRSGEFITLNELCKEVGRDAARFFYVFRSHDQHLDFNLDLAKSKNNENPVYYIQYAYARIHKVLKELKNHGLVFDKQSGISSLEKLSTQHETEIITKLSAYPDVITQSAQKKSVHSLANYLVELAQLVHSYYSAHRFIVENIELRNARIALITAASYVIKNGLSILGVSAPEQM
jgi:arginyl-tRNA synthetase